jgi:hypothetical protein
MKVTPAISRYIAIYRPDNKELIWLVMSRVAYSGQGIHYWLDNRRKEITSPTVDGDDLYVATASRLAPEPTQASVHILRGSGTWLLTLTSHLHLVPNVALHPRLRLMISCSVNNLRFPPTAVRPICTFTLLNTTP